MKEKFKTLSRAILAVAAFVLVFGLGANDAKAYGLTQVSQDQTSVSVSWNAPTVYRGTTVTAMYLGIGDDGTSATNNCKARQVTLATNATGYTFTGLQPGKSYSVCVKYDYRNSNGRVSTENSVTSGTIRTLPGKVTGLNQERWYRWALSCNVAWNEQTGVDGYEYQWMDHKGKIIDSATNSSHYSNGFSKPVKNYNVYKAKVRAYSVINGQTYYGDWSDEAYFFTQPSKSDRDAVVGAKISGGKLKVNWKKMNGVSGYNVYVSTNQTSGFKKVKSVKSNKGSVSVSKLGKKKFQKGKTYYIYVQAYKKVGGATFTTGVNYVTVLKNNRTTYVYADSNGQYQ